MSRKDINSYHACSGTTSEWPIGSNNGSGNMQNADGHRSTGMFAVWLSSSIQDFIEGTSNTLMFSEALAGKTRGTR